MKFSNLITIFAFVWSSFALANAETLPKTFKVKGLIKGNFTSASLRNQNLTVISFFASWCGKCSETMYQLNSLANEMDDVQWVALSVDEDVGSAKQYFKYLPKKYHVLKNKSYFDQDVKLASAIDVNSLPAYVIVDRLGQVVHSGTGHPNANGLKLIRSILEKKVH